VILDSNSDARISEDKKLPHVSDSDKEETHRQHTVNQLQTISTLWICSSEV